jgi:hypothetical protein
MKNNNQIANCTHEVPKNKFGIFAMHCFDNEPINARDLNSIIDGPITAIESDFKSEIAKPVNLKQETNAGSS